MTLARSFVARGAWVSVALGTLAALPSNARANPDYLQAFRDRYDASSTLVDDIELATGSACFTCHNSNAFFGDWNCYRRSLILRLREGRSIQQALADIELTDSDGDGVNNLDEIRRPRAGQPGQIGYNPGLIGPTGTDPCLTLVINGAPGSNLVVTNRLETPPTIVSTGACCFGSTCSILASTDCAGPGRRFVSTASACNTSGNARTPCCKADFNQSGSVSVQDIFDFLGSWFVAGPAADANASGAISVQDIFDFLAAWFNGC